MNLFLKGALAGCIASAVTVFANGRPETVAEIHASCDHAEAVTGPAATARGILSDAVKGANLGLAQARALTLRGQSRVRLVFSNGGWVEFRPDRTAIAEDALPAITAIQFARLPTGPAACHG